MLILKTANSSSFVVILGLNTVYQIYSTLQLVFALNTLVLLGSASKGNAIIAIVFY